MDAVEKAKWRAQAKENAYRNQRIIDRLQSGDIGLFAERQVWGWYSAFTKRGKIKSMINQLIAEEQSYTDTQGNPQ